MVESSLSTLKIEDLRFKIFILLIAILCPLSIGACKKAKVEAKPAVTLTAEQEQQFTYYWYAAKEALNKEKYGVLPHHQTQ